MNLYKIVENFKCLAIVKAKSKEQAVKKFAKLFFFNDHLVAYKIKELK